MIFIERFHQKFLSIKHFYLSINMNDMLQFSVHKCIYQYMMYDLCHKHVYMKVCVLNVHVLYLGQNFFIS